MIGLSYFLYGLIDCHSCILLCLQCILAAISCAEHVATRPVWGAAIFIYSEAAELFLLSLCVCALKIQPCYSSWL